jgi:murein DD-endopeptidase MepM/ murein hydrolase activator NlpD
MIKIKSSPIPCEYPFSYRLLFHIDLLQRHRVAANIALALFFIVLSISTVSAQTRARRTQEKPEESSQRVDDKKRAVTAAPVKPDNGKSVVPSSLTRKTALTYATQPGNQNAKRPVLVNEITVSSRVGVTTPSPVRLSTVSRPNTAAANIPSIWPVAGPLSSGFGVRGNPFGGSSREFHKGQDIAAPIGTPVMATADGVVTVAGWLRGYGWVVYIDHGNGISTRYGHLSRIDVAVGQTIKRGEQLGLVGSTGRSTGPHLHYEVLINGQATNPIPYLPTVTAPRS